MFAVSATVLLGIVGLATEAGTWYVAREKVFNAADAAAMAGALASVTGADPIAAAGTASSANGYGATNLTATPGAASGQYAGVGPATQATVSVTFLPVLASLFNGSAPITVSATAVGQLKQYGDACALSLAGPLTVTQSLDAYSNGQCFLASNDTSDGDGVSIGANGSSIVAQGVTSVTDCSNCPSVPMTGGFDSNDANYLAQPGSSFQPPTPDPYAAAVNALSLPTTASAITAITAPGQTNPGQTPQSITISSDYQMVPSGGDALGAKTCVPASGTYCAYYNTNLTIAAGTTTLSPGTYLFVNSSLTIQPGATVQCVKTDNLSASDGVQDCDSTGKRAPGGSPYGYYGVTIVMIGTPGNTGGLTIQPGATVVLSAQQNSDVGWSALNGILMYRDANGPADINGAPAVSIADIAGTTRLNGVLYFPTSDVAYAANFGTALSTPSRSILVANTISLGYPGQTSPTLFNPACGLFGAALPKTQVVTVVQ